MVPLTVHEKFPIARAVIPTRVLVVDEEPLIRWSLCSMLVADGFDAVSAADTTEAGRVASQWPPPKVVLFDLTGADAAGAELLFAVRCVNPDCRFIVMTAASDRPPDAILKQGIEWIQKPFDLRDVLRVVEDLATRSPSRAAQPGRVA